MTYIICLHINHFFSSPCCLPKMPCTYQPSWEAKNADVEEDNRSITAIEGINYIYKIT